MNNRAEGFNPEAENLEKRKNARERMDSLHEQMLAGSSEIGGAEGLMSQWFQEAQNFLDTIEDTNKRLNEEVTILLEQADIYKQLGPDYEEYEEDARYDAEIIMRGSNIPLEEPSDGK